MNRARNPGQLAKRVLVIKLSAIGDFMLALGAMREVREFHPNSHITLLTTPMFKDFAAHCPYFDQVDTDGRPPNAKATAVLIKRLRKARYDIIYDFQTSGRTKNYFQALRPNPPLWSGNVETAAFPHVDEERETLHTIERLTRQLEIAGVGPFDGFDPHDPPMENFEWVESALQNAPSLRPAFFGLSEPFMLMIPGASAHRGAKRWPEERYAQLARMIADEGVQPVIIGGKAEGEIASQIASAEPRAKNLVTRTTFFQIISLAKKASFVVGNDTGPMHMATLSGAPGVALFATDESNPDKAQPRGSTVVVLHAPRLEMVSVADVYQATRALGRLPVSGALTSS